jgi:hypothetical protein
VCCTSGGKRSLPHQGSWLLLWLQNHKQGEVSIIKLLAAIQPWLSLSEGRQLSGKGVKLTEIRYLCVLASGRGAEEAVACGPACRYHIVGSSELFDLML